MAGILAALAPYAGTAAKVGLSYLATEAPTIVKYLAKSHLLSGNITPKEVLEKIREKALTKHGREELLGYASKGIKVGGKIGHQALGIANKLGLGGQLTRKLQEGLSGKVSNIHEALGHINKLHQTYF